MEVPVCHGHRARGAFALSKAQMINLTVKTREGAIHAIQAEPQSTVMEAIRRSDIYELQALCGGSCSCATCHVFVESGPDGLGTPASEDEDELLDSSSHRSPRSRLSCQITLDERLDGLMIEIAPED